MRANLSLTLDDGESAVMIERDGFMLFLHGTAEAIRAFGAEIVRDADDEAREENGRATADSRATAAGDPEHTACDHLGGDCRYMEKP